MPKYCATAPKPGNAPPPSHSKLDEEDRLELEKLEAAVERMKKHTPRDPYTITIDQERKHRYQYQWRSQQYQWLHGAPFRFEEGEGVQYQTFVYQAPGSSMLSLHAQIHPDDERPNTASSTRNATGANTPAQGPKKVMSFGAYKKKQAGETPTRDTLSVPETDKSGKQSAVKGPAERVKAMELESADMLKSLEEDDKAEAAAGSDLKKEVPRVDQALSKSPELKRKREEHNVAKDKAPEPNGHASPPPSKKIRTETSASAPKETKRPRSPSPVRRPAGRPTADSEAHMPPKLSPLRDGPPKLSPLRDVPPKLSPLRDEPPSPDVFRLPPRISPDLPDNITATLRATERERVVRPSKQSKHGANAPEMNGTSTMSKKPEQHKSPRASSRSPDRATEETAVSKSSEKSTAQATKPHSDDQEATTGERRKSLVAKIKFKKARKEDVQRILKLPARPDKHIASPPSTPPTSDREDAEIAPEKGNSSRPSDKLDPPRRSGKGVAQKIGPTAKKSEEKRPAAEKRPRAELTADDTIDSEPPLKRKRAEDSAPEPSSKKRQVDGVASQASAKKKLPSTLDLKKTPSTPAQQDIPSPAVPGLSKSQMVTPVTRKDLLHAKRENSTDSQTNTPSAQPNTPTDRSSTSQPNGTASRPTSSATSQPPKPSGPRAQAWASEQNRLERIGRDLKHAASGLLDGSKPSLKTRQAGAAKAIESLICYLLAFTCADRASLVADQTPTYRPWRSLPPFCSFVSRTTQDFPALHGLSSAILVAIHAHVLNLATQRPAEAPSRDSLIELSAALRKAAVTADELLDVDVLMGDFPRTWSKRTKTPIDALRTEDYGEPKNLLREGGYRLPVGVQTDPLLAARAGLAVLKEWVAAKGLEYEYRVST